MLTAPVMCMYTAHEKWAHDFVSTCVAHLLEKKLSVLLFRKAKCVFDRQICLLDAPF